ncbi:MAG TPA: tRNA dihydrouridine synthase DusB [Clostridiales bacterium]|jgi:tRNA-dihydrouridine synthase B|nr:tRNA dihydrouridine synthase DusB [Clostridiales bacterium]
MNIGTLQLKNNIFVAPMAGITDTAFRTICSEMGAGLLFTEMISAKGLYYNDTKTKELMNIEDKNRPMGIQLFGSEPDIFVEVIEKYINNNERIDLIDLNLGCPAPKIVKNGDGSALMKNPDLIGEIVYKIKRVANKPVTAKIRAGWDEDSINAVKVGKIIQEAGADALTVHGRHRQQFYSGKADWDVIKEVKENLNIPVIGNGDIFTVEDAKGMEKKTGCDGIMLARGILGNPWLIKSLSNIYNNEEIEVTSKEKLHMILRHFELIEKYKGRRRAILEMRKHTGWYIKGMENAAKIRDRINKVKEKKEFEKILKELIV